MSPLKCSYVDLRKPLMSSPFIFPRPHVGPMSHVDFKKCNYSCVTVSNLGVKGHVFFVRPWVHTDVNL